VLKAVISGNNITSRSCFKEQNIKELQLPNSNIPGNKFSSAHGNKYYTYPSALKADGKDMPNSSL
jgi:hypothetical protein